MVHGSLELFEQRHYGTLLLLVYVCSLLRMASFCFLAQCEQSPRLPCHLKIKSKTKIKTTRSNCLKFRVKGCYIFPFREDCDGLLNVGLNGVILILSDKTFTLWGLMLCWTCLLAGLQNSRSFMGLVFFDNNIVSDE